MVDLFDAYRILNQSVLNVINDCVSLSVLEVEDKPIQIRMVENPYSISEKLDKVSPVIVAHNLQQYVNRFYSINMETTEVCLLDFLIHLDKDKIDLREFGGDDLCV